jgi:hypothetical protein
MTFSVRPSLRDCVTSYIVKPVEFDSLMKAISAVGFCWLTLTQRPRSLAGERSDDE